MKKFKNIYLVWVVVLILGAFAFGCDDDDDDDSGDTSMMSAYETSPETWDMLLTPLNADIEKYFIEVVTGSPSPFVNVSKQVGSGMEDLGNYAVTQGVAIPLEPCGPKVTFVPPNGTFSLTAGDEWAVMEVGGQIVGPIPTNTVDSAAIAMAEANTDCAAGCPSGLFLGTPGLTLSPDMGANILSGVEVQAGDYLINGYIPELYMLTFSLNPLVPGLVNAGDDIQVSYKRKMVSDGEGMDFLYVRLINDRVYETVESYSEEIEDELQEVSYQTTATGSFIGVNFTIGLSSSDDKLMLDDFEVKVNGAQFFFDDFEGTWLKDGLPSVLWLGIVGEEEKGEIDMTTDAGEVLSGSQSLVARGGRLFRIYGQRAEFEGTEGMEFNLTDGTLGDDYFMGVFMGASEGGIVTGLYNGRNYDETCTESGSFFVMTEPEGSADASGNWTIIVEAELSNCDNPSYEGSMDMTYTGLVIQQMQTSVAGVLTGATIVDSESNQLTTMGVVAGDALILQMSTAVPVSSFYGLSLIGGVGETEGGGKGAGGQVMGFASPDPLRMWETCEISGTFEGYTIP